jgi:RNA-splicing ligase RtcB
MKITNLTEEPTGLLRNNWLPYDLDADQVVFLPDACPGKAPLPTGTAVRTRQPDWRRFALSDCGCGMRLLRAGIESGELTSRRWSRVAKALKKNKGGLGDLGGGNHFVDALSSHRDGRLYLLVHTGSRHESGLVDDLTDQPDVFDHEFDRIVDWAARNRARIQKIIEAILGPLELVLDLPHNTYEKLPNGGAIIRKGSVQVEPGDLNIIPAHLKDDVALVRATPRVEEILCSLSHGTGRAMPTSEAKRLAQIYDFKGLRRDVMIPDQISDASLRGEGPFAYRDLEPCLASLQRYVEVEERFGVVGYVGHL